MIYRAVPSSVFSAHLSSPVGSRFSLISDMVRCTTAFLGTLVLSRETVTESVRSSSYVSVTLSSSS